MSPLLSGRCISTMAAFKWIFILKILSSYFHFISLPRLLEECSLGTITENGKFKEPGMLLAFISMHNFPSVLSFVF
jgi:hypothetical protein